MASTTKIMTALITLEQPGLDEYFTVDSKAIQVEGSSMGLQEGDQVTLLCTFGLWHAPALRQRCGRGRCADCWQRGGLCPDDE